MVIQQTIKYDAERDRDFSRQIMARPGGEKLFGCIQCGTCSATCPVSIYMDYTPRQLMALTRAGFKKEVLSSLTVWLCASCYACSVDCPKEIKITDIMYALKRRAIQEGVYPKRFPIPVLAREFFRMVRTRGRVTESQLVLRLYLLTNWLALVRMWRLGLNLMRTGRFSLKSEKMKNREALAHMFGPGEPHLQRRKPVHPWEAQPES
jgi:heterodisulfide reductase subunit C